MTKKNDNQKLLIAFKQDLEWIAITGRMHEAINVFEKYKDYLLEDENGEN